MFILCWLQSSIMMCRYKMSNQSYESTKCCRPFRPKYLFCKCTWQIEKKIISEDKYKKSFLLSFLFLDWFMFSVFSLLWLFSIPPSLSRLESSPSIPSKEHLSKIVTAVSLVSTVLAASLLRRPLWPSSLWFVEFTPQHWTQTFASFHSNCIHCKSNRA